MSFDWEELHRDWLAGGRVAVSPEDVVRAFRRVEGQFGRQWVEATRVRQEIVHRGPQSVLSIITLGRELELLQDAKNANGLLARLRRRQPSASAELHAIYVTRSGASGTELELEPQVVIGDRSRAADFRVRRSSGDWIYVEVSQPQESDAQADVRAHLQRLTSIVDECDGSFGVEVFLARDASSSEVERIAAEILDTHRNGIVGAVELPDQLGTLYWNQQSPGNLTIDCHGRPYTPRLSTMAVTLKDGAHRHVAVRWPFTDERAERFLRNEAAQLPAEAPGLVMLQTSGAVGAMKAWRGLLEPRLGPDRYRWVSGVGLMSAGVYNTDGGEEWRAQVKLLVNPHATHSLPHWLRDQLSRFPSGEADLLG